MKLTDKFRYSDTNRYPVNSLSYQGYNFAFLRWTLLSAVPLLNITDHSKFSKKDKIVLIQDMKAYRRVEVLLHSFLVLLVDGRDRKALRPGRSTSGKECPVKY